MYEIPCDRNVAPAPAGREVTIVGPVVTGDGAGAAPEQARRRYLAAVLADSRRCEGEPRQVRVFDRSGQGTTACLLHGAVLLASLDGGRVGVVRGERSGAVEVRRRAGRMRPFAGVWTGPGVQRVNSLEEAAVFPSALDPLLPEPLPRSSGPGNGLRGRWAARPRYQAGLPRGGGADNVGDVAWATGSKEGQTR